MRGGQIETPVRGQAQPGLDNRYATAAGTSRLSDTTDAGTPYHIIPTASDAFRIVVSGRIRWSLDRLREAGARGCTPITDPAPRWAAYVHSLREMGVAIETVTEAHGGQFAGHHARYVLRCQVVPDWKGGVA